MSKRMWLFSGKGREIRSEITSLAQQVFDYDSWNIYISGSLVSIQPTGHQIPAKQWGSVEECIDDLRTRAMLRFTPWEKYTHD